jgi:hypothetical protein
MMTAGPYRFARDLYPLRIEALDPQTGEILWETTVEAPEGLAAVYIPPLAQQFGHAVRMRIVWADGTITDRSGETVN